MANNQMIFEMDEEKSSEDINEKQEENEISDEDQKFCQLVRKQAFTAALKDLAKFENHDGFSHDGFSHEFRQQIEEDFADLINENK